MYVNLYSYVCVFMYMCMVFICMHELSRHFYTAAMICTVDTSATTQDGRVIVRLNDKCLEDPSTFESTLSYGSCPSSQALRETDSFDSNGVTSFKLDVSNVVESLCIQVIVTHQAQQSSLCMYSVHLPLNSCSIAEIRSVGDSNITVKFSLTESSGEVPHGTVATFEVLSCALQLIGANHATCNNGMWNDLSPRTSSSKSS